jgi:photosystem II stability/assembly factor-like uncharacterized protein
MSKRLILLIALGLMLLSSAGIVTFLSAQEGDASVSPVAAGPSSGTKVGRAMERGDGLESAFAPDRIYRTGSASVWRVSTEEGLLVSTDGGKSWVDRGASLPSRAVWPFDTPRPPIVTGLSVDPTDADRVGLTTLDTLFLSENGGASWEKVELKDPLKANDQLTCVALSPMDASAAMVGTSFHGFFETLDRGKTWTSLSEPFVPLKLGGGNYEEISAVAYHPAEPGLIYFNLGFGKGLYWFRKGAKTVSRVDFPGGERSPIRDLAFRRASQDAPWALDVRTDEARWSWVPDTGAWTLVEPIGTRPPLAADKAARLQTASDKFGIYVSSFWASGELLQTHLAFLKKHGLNSIVVDFKDDFGYVTYNTTLAAPYRIGAVQKRFRIEDLVRVARENGLYLIGRIVVFRDKQLYNADGYAYAAWDRAAKGPWRYLKKSVDEATGEESVFQGEYWVDPYCEYVWDYNIAIARELEGKGVDEVQFDYIRFPSDGDLSKVSFRFRKEGMGKLEALESFLAKARASIGIPLSTDVYGYCGWARISNWVAQNIEMFSRYVDVIQPMFYPSHFPRDFLGSMEYLPRAGYIYQEGTKRSAWIVEGRSVIRPYVQAFRIGSETSFSMPVSATYLVNQVQGSLQGAASGFTLWNASNDYYMATVPLGPIIQGRGNGNAGR